MPNKPQDPDVAELWRRWNVSQQRYVDDTGVEWSTSLILMGKERVKPDETPKKEKTPPYAQTQIHKQQKKEKAKQRKERRQKRKN